MRSRLAVGVEAHLLDGALDRLHAAGHLVALEGRARSRAGDDDAAVEGQRDLGVGADVDRQGRAALAGEPRRGDHGKRVGAHEAGDRRREVHAALGVDGDAEVGGALGHRLGQSRCEGRRAHAQRRDPQRQVVHDGVADDRHVVDVACVDLLARAERGEQLVDALADGRGELLPEPLVDGLGHARDDVLAVAHLRVLDRLLIDEAAVEEIEQVDDDLGGADVDGGAVGERLDVGRLDVDDLRRRSA